VALSTVARQRVREPRNVRLLCRYVLDFEIVEQSDEVRLTVTSHPTGQAALRFIFT